MEFISPQDEKDFRHSGQLITIDPAAWKAVRRLIKNSTFAFIGLSVLFTSVMFIRENIDATVLHGLFLSYALIASIWFAYCANCWYDYTIREQNLLKTNFGSFCICWFIYFVGLYNPNVVIEPNNISFVPQRVSKEVPMSFINTSGQATIEVPAKSTKQVVEPYIYGEAPIHTSNYIQKFWKLAVTEKDKFGIPASITLAQGILESASGTSTLARTANNHFGVKTFNKLIKHVIRHDDSPTDKFKVYNNAWESFRDHSLIVKKSHYKTQYLANTDYVGWADALRKGGYATEKNYAIDLINIINKYQLFRFDTI